MSDHFENLCAWVYRWWMEASRAHGRTSASSRHDTGELMVPYDELAEIDREDDRRAVRAVLNGLAKLPRDVALALIASAPADEELLVQIREAAAVMDPPPAVLADRCADAAAREDGRL